MNNHNLPDRRVADLGQIQLTDVYADKGYFSEYVEINVDDVYRLIEREEGPDGERLRSCLARAITMTNPVVENLTYLGRKVRIVKAVRHA